MGDQNVVSTNGRIRQIAVLILDDGYRGFYLIRAEHQVSSLSGATLRLNIQGVGASACGLEVDQPIHIVR